jgi:hypothetical protein
VTIFRLGNKNGLTRYRPTGYFVLLGTETSFVTPEAGQTQMAAKAWFDPASLAAEAGRGTASGYRCVSIANHLRTEMAQFTLLTAPLRAELA